MLTDYLKCHVDYMIKHESGEVESKKEIIQFRSRTGLTMENQILIELSITRKVHIDQIILQSYYDI